MPRISQPQPTFNFPSIVDDDLAREKCKESGIDWNTVSPSAAEEQSAAERKDAVVSSEVLAELIIRNALLSLLVSIDSIMETIRDQLSVINELDRYPNLFRLLRELNDECYERVAVIDAFRETTEAS